MKKWTCGLITAGLLLSINVFAEQADQSQFICKSSSGVNDFDVNYKVSISQPDINGNRVANVSWLQNGEVTHAEKLQFDKTGRHPRFSQYTHTYPGGAGPSYLTIDNTPYYWLGKKYYEAHLSGLLFENGSEGIRLECAMAK